MPFAAKEYGLQGEQGEVRLTKEIMAGTRHSECVAQKESEDRVQGPGNRGSSDCGNKMVLRMSSQKFKTPRLAQVKKRPFVINY